MADDLFWQLPLLGGAGYGAHKGYQTFQAEGGVGAWTQNLGEAGMAARASIGGGQNYEKLLQDMLTSQSFLRGHSSGHVRRAIEESLRVSMLQSSVATTSEIEAVAQAIRGAPIHEAFEGAIGAVSKGGATAPFYHQLTRFLETEVKPGVMFNVGTLGEAMPELPRLGAFTTAEEATVGAWKKMMPAGWEMAAPGAYETEGVRMAELRFAHPSMEWSALGKQPLTFQLPLTPGSYRAGKGLETLYATSEVARVADWGTPNLALRKWAFGDYYMRRVSDFLPSLMNEQNITQRGVRQLVNQFEQDITRYMMWTPGKQTVGQQAINQIFQQSLMVEGLAERARVGDIDVQMSKLIQQGYYPPTSPGAMVAGRVYQNDPRAFWPHGELFPTERRPLQGIRPYEPTPAALVTMRKSTFGVGGAFRRDVPFLSSPMQRELARAGYVAPQMAVAYAVPGTNVEAALQNINLAPEQIALRKNMMRLYETQSWRIVDIAPNTPVSDEQLSNWMTKSMKGEPVAPLAISGAMKNRPLGYTGRGEAILPGDFAGLTEKIHRAEYIRRTGADPSMRLHILQTHSPKEYVKTFGTLKQTTRVMEDAAFQEVMDHLGIPYKGAHIDGVTYANDILKNRSLLRAQMQQALAVTANWELPAITDAVVRSEMENFLNQGDKYAERYLANEAAVLTRAKRWGLRLGPIGGLLPAAAKEGLISPREYRALTRIAGGEERLMAQKVYGMPTSWVGAHRYTGAGGGIRGTMEHRGILQLLSQEWGRPIAGAVTRSMPSYGPEISEIELALRSMAGEAVGETRPLAGLSLNVRAAESEIFRSTGYAVDIGRKLEALPTGKLYIPAAGAVRNLGEFRLPSGEIMGKPVGRAINDFLLLARETANLEAGAARLAQLEVEAKNLSQTLFEAGRQAMYGVGGGHGIKGAMRGPMTGSQFFPLESIMPKTGEVRNALARGMALEENVMQISERAGLDMYDDLVKHAHSEELASIGARKEAFMTGERVPGMVYRHGMIGMYSGQPVWYEKAIGPTSATDVFMRAPVQISAQLRTTIPGLAGKVDVTPLLGMAADLDDDRLIGQFIADQKTNTHLESLLDSGRHRAAYRQFGAEATILRKLAKGGAAAAAIGQIPDWRKMALGAAKLRIGAGEVGLLSVPISEAKLAAAHYGAERHGPEWVRRFLLVSEVMEQQVISAKKMDLAKGSLAKRIAGGFREIETTGGKELTKVFHELFGRDLEKGISYTMEGVKDPQTLSINPKALFERELPAVMAEAKAKGGTSQYFYSLVRGTQGAQELPIAEMTERISAARSGTADMVSTLAARGTEAGIQEGFGSKLSREALGVYNRAKRSAGSVAKSWGRPALYGLAGTAALMMLMGGPELQPMTPPPPSAQGDRAGLIGMSNQIARSQLQGMPPLERDLRPESFPIPGAGQAEVYPPGMMTPSTYMTQQPPMGMRLSARARASGIDTASVEAAINQVAPGIQANITVRDDRSQLTSQRLSDMLGRAY